MDEFRNSVVGLGSRAVEIMDSFLSGEAKDPEIIRQATKVMDLALKAENMTQNRDIQHKRLAMGLIKHLPNDEKLREAYVSLTNPDVKPALLGRPAKE